jgi:L-iditol 2-dehydrogenase
MAEELGASAVIDASEAEDVALELRRLTDGGGVDVAVEAAGAPATTRVAFDSVRNGGLVVFNGEQPRVELSPSEDFIRRDVAAVGSWFYFFSEYASMESLWREGFPAASLITHRVPLESAQDAYTTMAQGKCGKIVLEYGGAR